MAAVIRRNNVHHYFLAALALVALTILLSFVRTHKAATYPSGYSPAPAAAPR
jgi:hypothetical protein